MKNANKVTVSKAEYAALKALNLNDTHFNPRVYLNMEARFGDCQPKHGVIFDTPVRRRKGKLVIDTYGRGDVHNVRTQTEFSRKRRTNWNVPMPFPADLSLIRDSLMSGKLGSRHDIVLGANSDPFMWMDAKYGITRTTLELLINHGSKIKSLEIHTRSDLIAHDDYLELLRALDYSLGRFVTIYIHMPKGDSQVQRLIEPGAPSRQRRFQAARKLRTELIGGTRIRIVREGTVKANQRLAGIVA